MNEIIAMFADIYTPFNSPSLAIMSASQYPTFDSNTYFGSLNIFDKYVSLVMLVNSIVFKNKTSFVIDMAINSINIDIKLILFLFGSSV